MKQRYCCGNAFFSSIAVVGLNIQSHYCSGLNTSDKPSKGRCLIICATALSRGLFSLELSSRKQFISKVQMLILIYSTRTKVQSCALTISRCHFSTIRLSLARFENPPDGARLVNNSSYSFRERGRRSD